MIFTKHMPGKSEISKLRKLSWLHYFDSHILNWLLLILALLIIEYTCDDYKTIDKVTMVHIHQGKIGENGSVAVTLIIFQKH